MEVAYLPYSPWQWVVTVAATTAAVLLLVRFVTPVSRVRVFGERPSLAYGVLVASLSSAGLLTLAVWNPTITHRDTSAKPHLVVVIDVSKSIISGPGGWSEVRDEAAVALAGSVSDLSQETRANAGASLVLVGAQPNLFRERFAIAELPKTLRRVTERDLPSGSETDLEAGLARAGKLLSSTADQGVVVLVTDGNQTTGDGLDAAKQLATSGIPVYVLALKGWSSAVHLAAIDLPRQAEAGQETYLRGLLWNRSDTDEPIDLQITRNAGYHKQGDAFAQEVLGVLSDDVLQAKSWRRIREGLVFRKVGIHYVDVTLEVSGGNSVVQRRLFTHISGPPRLLAVGGDNRWVEWFSTDEFQIDLADAAELSAETQFSDYDAVVIHSVFATQFQDGVLMGLAETVREDGLGLFLANGGHVPLEEESPTVLTSYRGTPIEPLLPVSVEPRPFAEDVPPLQIVILIDQSGSMAGGKIAQARAIAKHIVETMMRPVDRLDVVLFTTGADPIVVDQAMTAENKAAALAKIDAIVAGGGTQPELALKTIASRKLLNCGLIFLSDGEFSPVHERPECRAYIFDIGQDWVDPNFPLDLAEPIPVGSDFNLAGLTLSVFDPEPRNKYFELGTFTPLRAGRSSAATSALVIPPDLRLDGSAVSYVKREADLIAVRPKLIDPVLAYMSTGFGTVGAMTGEMSADWLADSTNKQAARQWILQTVPYSARDRYSFDIADLGKAIELCLQVHLPGSEVPELDRLSAALEWPGEQASVDLRPDAVDKGAFCGSATLPADRAARKGFLAITESGPDALGQSQRIPLLVPAASSAASVPKKENYSAGTNWALLRQLTSAGAGGFIPIPGQALLHSRPGDAAIWTAWPWLLAAALLSYVAAVGLRRVNA